MANTGLMASAGSMAYAGEIAALGAAAAWAVSAVLYRRLGAAIPPLALNLVKGLIAAPLLGVVLALWPEAAAGASLADVALLAVSGAIGIGLGDTAFFAALNRLGERRTILMAETLAPPLTAALAFGLLGEVLSPAAVLGIVVTLAGVAWVVVERSGEATIDHAAARRGVVCGLIAAVCQAVGAVMARSVLADSDVSPALSALVRIAAGVAVLLVWMPIAREPYLPAPLRRRSTWRSLAVATLLGTFLGIFFQQVSYKHTSVGVAQTLIATSSLLVLPIVALRGEAISARAIAGAVVALAGVALLLIVG